MIERSNIVLPNISILDPYAVEAFLAIVRLGSLSRASEELSVTQSAVSNRLRGLEDAAGVMLVQRGRGLRRVSLTREGELFLSIAQRWEALARDAQGLRQSLPSLSIGAPDSVNRHVLMAVYGSLASRLQLRIVTANSAELYTRLGNRDIDLAVVLYERTDPGFVSQPFLTEPMMLVATGPRHRNRRIMSSRELDPATGIYVDWGPSFQGWIHERWEITTFAIQVDTASSIGAFLDDRERWTIVPESVARSLRAPGRFVRRIADPPPNRVLSYVRSTATLTLVAVSALAEFEEAIRSAFPPTAASLDSAAGRVTS